MKKTTRVMAALLAMVMALTMFAGCGKGDFVGKWTLNGEPSVVLEINKDDTYQISEDGYVDEKGTWTAKGKEITLTSDGFSITGEKKGKTITFSQTGETISFTKQ